MNPFCIPFAIHNMGGALLAMDLGFMGPNYPINTACATGNYCILSCAPSSQLLAGRRMHCARLAERRSTPRWFPIPSIFTLCS